MRGIPVNRYKSIHSLNRAVNFHYFKPRAVNSIYYAVERYMAYARVQNAVIHAKKRGENVPLGVRHQMLHDLEKKSRVVTDNKSYQLPKIADQRHFNTVARKDVNIHNKLRLSTALPIKYKSQTINGKKQMEFISFFGAESGYHIHLEHDQIAKAESLGVHSYLRKIDKRNKEHENLRHAQEKRGALKQKRLMSGNNTKDKYAQIDKAYIFKDKTGHYFVSFKGAFVAGPYKNHYMTNNINSMHDPYMSHYANASGTEWNRIMKLSHNPDLIFNPHEMDFYTHKHMNNWGELSYTPAVVQHDKVYVTKNALVDYQRNIQNKLAKDTGKKPISSKSLRQNENSLENKDHPSASRDLYINSAYVVGESNEGSKMPIIAVSMSSKGKDGKYHYLINNRFSNGSVNHFQFMPSSRYSVLLKKSDNEQYLKIKHPHSSLGRRELLKMAEPTRDAQGKKHYKALINPAQEVKLRAPLHHWGASHAYIVFPSSVRPTKQKVDAKRKEKQNQNSLSRYYKLPNRQQRQQNNEFFNGF